MKILNYRVAQTNILTFEEYLNNGMKVNSNETKDYSVASGTQLNLKPYNINN